MFEYAERAVVTSLQPSFGTTGAATTITVVGSSLLSMTSCRLSGPNFDDALTSTLLSSSSVTCFVPGLRVPGPYVLEFSAGDYDSAVFSQTLEISSPATITSVQPSMVHESGSDIVTVTGTNFRKDSVFVFGNSPAEYASMVSTTTFLCRTPPHEPGNVTFQVGLSGLNVLGRGVDFMYLAEIMRLQAIHPSRGSVLGGTVITVSVEGR
eukprot:2313987-Rhodomonas_salina.1